jgi:hypothetical protein
MSNKNFKAYDLNNNLVSISGYSSTRFVVGEGDDCPYRTIQSAIDDAYAISAQTHQIILVRHGLYKEDLAIRGNISIVGMDTPGMLSWSNSISAGFPAEDAPAKVGGVWLEGVVDFKEDAGFGTRELNIKNIQFLPKNYSSSNTLTDDIFVFPGDGGNYSVYNIENCRFFTGTFNHATGFSGKFLNCSNIDFPSKYEGCLIVFKDCFFNLPLTHPDAEFYICIDLVGSNGTKYLFDNCEFKTSNTTLQMIGIYDTSGDTWYSEFKNCTMENITIQVGGDGSLANNIKIDNCNIKMGTAYPFVSFVNATGPFSILNSNVSSSNSNGLFFGTYPFTFDTSNTLFKNLNGDTVPGWIYVDGDSGVDYRTVSEVSRDNFILVTGPVYGVFSDTKDQHCYVNGANQPIATAAEFSITEEAYGISIGGDSNNRYTRIQFDYPGVYNIAFSFQLDRVSGSGTAIVNIWLRKNGNDVARSDTKVTMSGPSGSSKMVAAWNFVSSTLSTDYYEIMWAPTDEHIELIHGALVNTPGQERPEIPSTILTVWKL